MFMDHFALKYLVNKPMLGAGGDMLVDTSLPRVLF